MPPPYKWLLPLDSRQVQYSSFAGDKINETEIFLLRDPRRSRHSAHWLRLLSTTGDSALSYFTLRVLSALMATKPVTWQKLLANEDGSPFPFITYSRPIAILQRAHLDPQNALKLLNKWRDDKSVTLRSQSFRIRASEKIEWCLDEVIPRISEVKESLGSRGSAVTVNIAKQQYTGSFHLLVKWDDGTDRLVYFLGPKWTKKRVQCQICLLQVLAFQVYGMDATQVVLVDMDRKVVHENILFDMNLASHAVTTSKLLKDLLKKRAS